MAQGRRRNKRSHLSNQERRYTVRGVRREPVDISKLSKALIGLAMAEAERQAEAEHAHRAGVDTAPAVTAADQPRSGGVDDA